MQQRHALPAGASNKGISGMNSARASYIADFAGRATLVAFFGFLTTNKIMGVMRMLQTPEDIRFLDFAANLAGLAFVMLVVGMTIVRLKPLRNAEGFEPRLSALVGTGLSMGIIALPQADIGVGLHITALVLILVGWILSVYVLLWLGRAFSIMAQARRLVSGGPYAIVRHPLYLCEEFAVFGIVITHLSIEAVLIMVVQWLFQLRRMANEEKVLREAFPEYEAYAKGTPKVIPRLFPKLSLGHAQS
jgi:protein-S-isoprenylcysteine O-methyltransferase Ste14